MKIFAILFFLMLMMTETIFSQTPPTIEPGVSQTLARWRAANYSDVRYRLNLTLEKQAPLMRGTIEISVKLTKESAKNDLILDWRTTQFQNDKDKPFAEVLQVNESVIKQLPDSGNFAYRVDKEHIIIANRLLKAGENVIKINFASPIKTSGAAVTRYLDKEDGAEYVYSLFVPSDASTAFPVFDQPDLKARFKLEVESKTFDRVVSNAIGKTSDYNTNTNKFTFSETKPISTYVFAFAAGDFVDFQENRPVNEKGESIKALAMEGNTENFRVFVRRSQAAKFKAHEKEVFRLTREAVKNLESYFDYKFPFPKYDTILIPEFPFGGMEHAGATFLREASVIFPSEPTKNDFISRANLIFHEAAHQWFGDTVTMKWFDDLWLKEGFAEFMAYKTLEKVIPEYNAWKAFYERNKPLAYLTDSTKGTTPIYQEIPNLSAAKSAYGNIVYRKAPSFLRQAEFYLGEKEFQTAIRSFLKKYQFANAEWKDLLKEFEDAYLSFVKKEYSGSEKNFMSTMRVWAEIWVKKRGVPIYRLTLSDGEIKQEGDTRKVIGYTIKISQSDSVNENVDHIQRLRVLSRIKNKDYFNDTFFGYPMTADSYLNGMTDEQILNAPLPIKIPRPDLFFPNYQDYGYGIFLLDEQSRDYVLQNIQNEKDDFLRSMMWGTLWDSVREAELNPKDYVELAIKNIAVEQDESTIQAILSRVGAALNYYIASPSESEITDSKLQTNPKSKIQNPKSNDLVARLERVLEERIANAKTPGQRITFYRAYLTLASSAAAQKNLKDILAGRSKLAVFQLRTKDKFDIVTRLLILGDKDAPQLLANLEKTETSDDAKRYAYAARAGVPSTDSKAKYFRDFMTDKEISESWIEAAFAPFNSARHSDLTLPYLETALAELPNLKRSRKIFFVNGWLGAFIGGQKSEAALATVNKFLADNPNLDRDLRLKILENVDGLERAVKIRGKFGK